jgi:hypothetical protein
MGEGGTMKRVALLLLFCTAIALGQQQQPAGPSQIGSSATNLQARVEAPTYSDLYCSGFLTKQQIGRENYVIGGLNTPNQTQFAQGDILFLEGSGYQEGARYSVVREVVDPNRMPMFPEQRALMTEAGQPYAELGRVTITAIRGKTAIALVEFSCNAMVAGDLLVPFQEKSPLAYRPKTSFERFPSGASSVTGRIVMAKEFDTIAATGHKVYINVGADKGVKVGDYFRVVAGYDPAKMDRTEALSYKMPYSEEAQKNVPRVPLTRFAELPRRATAEAIVVNVTPTASTAMITLALEHVNVGDTVELEGAPSAPPK